MFPIERCQDNENGCDPHFLWVNRLDIEALADCRDLEVVCETISDLKLVGLLFKDVELE